MRYSGRVEYAKERRLREHNTGLYRLAHWPIWISVFFLAPGPLTFSLFADGFGTGNLVWLATVLIGTGSAGLRAQLPGMEARPYILRFDEDRPNPLYRRVCYTFAWNAALTYALLNLAALGIASGSGRWYMKQIYRFAYAPVCMTIMLLGATGRLPRVGASTRGEGTERRYFYGTVWAATAAQIVLLSIWKSQRDPRRGSMLKLAAFSTTLAVAGVAASLGLLPRTRPILPGDSMIAD